MVLPGFRLSHVARCAPAHPLVYILAPSSK